MDSAIDNLVDHVEPLVDVLAQLVLDSVNDDIPGVQQHIQILANNTTSLVNTTKAIALKEDDDQLIEDVTNAIMELSNSIEILIQALMGLFQRRGDHSASEAFSDAITIVGDAIRYLVEVTDETSRHRMGQLIRLALLKLKELYENYHTRGPTQLARDKSEYVQLNDKLRTVATKAERISRNEEQRRMYRESCMVLERMTNEFVDTLTDVNNGTRSFDDIPPLFERLNHAYKNIVEALKLQVDDSWNKIGQAYEFIKKIIQAAQEMQLAAKELKNSIENDDGNIDENLEKTMNAVRKLISVTKEALAVEEDPVKRQFLLKQIEDAAQYARMFQQAAAHAKQGNPEGTRLSKIAYNNLANTAQRIVLGTKIPKQGYSSEDYPIHITTTALESIGSHLMNSASSGDKDKVIDNAKKTAVLAQQTADTLISLAENIFDMQEKNHLGTLATQLQQQAVQLIKDAKAVYQNPTPENVAAMEASFQLLQELIREARQFESTPPGFVDLTYNVSNVQTTEPEPEDQDFVMELMFTEGDPELVKAAKAEALAALEIFSEAEKLTAGDPTLAALLGPLGVQLQNANKNMIAAAKLAATDPGNVQYQQQFNQAQKQLNAIVGQIVSVSAPSVNVENELQMLNTINRDFKPESGTRPETITETLMVAESVMGNLDKLLENLTFATPEDIINNTASVATQIKELARNLRDMAAATDNPQIKEALQSGASIIQDNSLRLKILSAVKAAQGGDSEGQLGAAAQVLKDQMRSVMNDISATNLRHASKNTEKSTSVLKKIAAEVRRARRN
jgi:hypothetical protein